MGQEERGREGRKEGKREGLSEDSVILLHLAN